MSDDQLNSMAQMMKNVDNNTLKSMLLAQGMDVSDEQINMMKMSMTPEMLKVMRDSDFNFSKTPKTTNEPQQSSSSNTGCKSSPPQMPDFSQLSKMNISQMMEFIQKNPELLKRLAPQLGQMFGGKEGNNEAMVKAMQNIIWLFSLPSKIKKFFFSLKGLCFIIFVASVFYGLFIKK